MRLNANLQFFSHSKVVRIVMISESALLLLAVDKLPPLARRGGILTPMTAFGDLLIERLQATGRFEFTSEVIRGASELRKDV